MRGRAVAKTGSGQLSFFCVRPASRRADMARAVLHRQFPKVARAPSCRHFEANIGVAPMDNHRDRVKSVGGPSERSGHSARFKLDGRMWASRNLKRTEKAPPAVYGMPSASWPIGARGVHPRRTTFAPGSSPIAASKLNENNAFRATIRPRSSCNAEVGPTHQCECRDAIQAEVIEASTPNVEKKSASPGYEVSIGRMRKFAAHEYDDSSKAHATAAAWQLERRNPATRTVHKRIPDRPSQRPVRPCGRRGLITDAAQAICNASPLFPDVCLGVFKNDKSRRVHPLSDSAGRH